MNNQKEIKWPFHKAARFIILIVVITWGLILSMIFSGCESPNVVSEADAMTIQKIESVSGEHKYKYLITDSYSNWIFYSDNLYTLGDTIYISNCKQICK